MSYLECEACRKRYRLKGRAKIEGLERCECGGKLKEIEEIEKEESRNLLNLSSKEHLTVLIIFILIIMGFAVLWFVVSNPGNDITEDLFRNNVDRSIAHIKIFDQDISFDFPVKPMSMEDDLFKFYFSSFCSNSC
jgi:uncharacterized membrane protein (DUF106 family)